MVAVNRFVLLVVFPIKCHFVSTESVEHISKGTFEDLRSTSEFGRFLLALNNPARLQHPITAKHKSLSGATQRISRAPVGFFSTSSSPRVAVFGGRGFIGSRTCRTLVEAGCDVVSVSLTDEPPEWAREEPWVQKVQWLSVKSAQESLGQLDAAVSCVGNIRPNPEWEGLFGLNFQQDLLERQNGDVNVQIAEAAKRAGARRFTYISVSSDVNFAYGGALMGYIKGKRQAEAAVRRLFGDSGVIVGPSLVYGNGRFDLPGKVYESVTASAPTKLLVKVLRKLNDISMSPQDRVNIIALSPPVDVDTAALAIAAGTLGSTQKNFINGSTEIAQVAEETNSESLEVAATQLLKSRSPVSFLTGVGGPSLLAEGAPSLEGAPFEGALVGARPFLFPLPYIIGLITFFVTIPKVPSPS